MTKKYLLPADFANLPEEYQLQSIHLDGVFVGKRKVGNLHVILFQLHSFYVEIYYKKYRKTVDHIVVENSTEILLPYLEQIPIDSLKGFDS
jgi:hypothetical protein